MFTKVSTAIQLVLAVAIFYLGYTIYSFTNKVGEIVDTYPKVIEDLSVLTKGLKVEEWLAFAEHIDELAPHVLDTVEDVRKSSAGRHYMQNITQKTVAKNTNTVILSHVGK